jgi:hypothetical protein
MLDGTRLQNTAAGKTARDAKCLGLLEKRARRRRGLLQMRVGRPAALEAASALRLRFASQYQSAAAGYSA